MAIRLRRDLALLRELQQSDKYDDVPIDDPRITAIHEAGHVAMGMVAQGLIPRIVTIAPNKEYQGMTDTTVFGQCIPADVSLIRMEILLTLAGGEAVELLTGNEDWEGCADDFDRVYSLQSALSDNEQGESGFEDLRFLTHRLMCYRRFVAAIEASADYLLEHPHLENDNVYPLFDLIHQTMGKRFVRAHRERVKRATSAGIE
jgi:hypothetical protein